jgi:hypothetical protein
MLKTTITVAALALATPALAKAGVDRPITPDEVAAAQAKWADGIVEIGKTYLAKGDYRARAAEHIRKHYAFEHGPVLFKPTLASDDQFRGSFDEALSYFVGGKIAEDKGFAIKPWTAIRWENEKTVTDRDSALAMGNYYFTDTSGEETKVEYTFAYTRGPDGGLRIVAHHSSVPFAAD